MVPAIVKVNAKSKFSWGRTLSTDMSLTPLLGEIAIPTTGTNAMTVPGSRTSLQKGSAMVLEDG
jgi:hypothetical protein